MRYVPFRNYDGKALTLRFNTRDDISEDFVHFYSDKYEAFSMLEIRAYANPETGDIKFYAVSCQDMNIMLGEIFCDDDRELCDWIRSFLYMHEAYFCYDNDDNDNADPGIREPGVRVCAAPAIGF